MRKNRNSRASMGGWVVGWAGPVVVGSQIYSGTRVFSNNMYQALVTMNAFSHYIRTGNKILFLPNSTRY